MDGITRQVGQLAICIAGHGIFERLDVFLSTILSFSLYYTFYGNEKLDTSQTLA